MNKKSKKQKKTYGLTFVKKNSVKKLPLYHVEWRDHAVSGAGDRWSDIDSVDVKTVTCYTVGFQVAEDDEAIALASNVSAGGGIGEIMSIIKSCIVKKTKL